MALTKNAAPAFENPDADTAGESAADARVRATLGAKVSGTETSETVETAEVVQEVVQEVVHEAAPASASREVVQATNHAVATSIRKADPFAELKNALHVNFDELEHLKVVSGNVIHRKSKRVMGTSVVLELLSFQDQTVMSPAGKKEDKEALNYLKFSDDGIHAKGTDELLTDWRKKAIEAGYTDAKIVERVILVGAVVEGGKCPDLNNELVQIDLAPRSLANFKTYRLGAAFKIGKGLLPAGANPLLVRVKAVPQSGNGNDWTDAEFEGGWLAKTE